MKDYRWSVLALVAANAVPLAGVLFCHWGLFSIMLLYWLENAVVGYFSVFKIALARGAAKNHPGKDVGRTATIILKIFMIPFFIVHYGMFWVVHGIFVIALFGSRFSGADPFAPSRLLEMPGAPRSGVLLALTLFMISHGVSFLLNYIRGGELRSARPDKLMFLPYGRVAAMHLVLLGGAFFLLFIGQFRIALALLVIVKTGLDLWGHLRERRKCAPAPAVAEPTPVPSA
ncbi:MAG: hypothetical protein JXQ27_00965 [Acidobacteria bacterium]|nr:hypothetical protein [Acidobacteriota bacterium]